MQARTHILHWRVQSAAARAHGITTMFVCQEGARGVTMTDTQRAAGGARARTHTRTR